MMPIDISAIDENLTKLNKTKFETETQIEYLEFIRDKFLNGTDDEKKIIFITGKLTIDNINLLIDTMHKSMKKWEG